MVIFQSASKIVFILIAVTVCITFATGKLPEDKFYGLALMAFTYYFSIKQAIVEKKEGEK